MFLGDQILLKVPEMNKIYCLYYASPLVFNTFDEIYLVFTSKKGIYPLFISSNGVHE